MPAGYYLETIEKIFCKHHLPRGSMEVEDAVLDMPAGYYLETIEKIFCKHHLPRGSMEVADRC
ncbi:hypothetical protein G3A43_41220, partial [Paraburkholderia aspalathi]|nr:hypothetical protein [Paraburkholderia aspalathi]